MTVEQVVLVIVVPIVGYLAKEVVQSKSDISALKASEQAREKEVGDVKAALIRIESKLDDFLYGGKSK